MGSTKLSNLTTDELRKVILEEFEVNKQLNKDSFENDSYRFNRKILEVEKGKDKVVLNEAHKQLCKFVDTYPSKQKLILMPRTHLKSTLITIGKTVQWLCKDPSTRILIANATYPMAVTFLNVIKRHLTQNKWIQLIWPEVAEIAKNAEKWSENAVTFGGIKKYGGEKEANVVCYGMGGNLVSQHYDKIILDDVVNENTVNTKEQIEKTINFYRRCQPLLEKNGEMVLVGTRWHMDDLYGWIMDKDNGVLPEFRLFIRQAIDNPMWSNEEKAFTEGKVLWPEKYSLEDLSKIRRKMGPYEFHAQYQNNPIPSEDADFKREWFHYYEYVDVKPKTLNKYTLVDPAISTDKHADYTAIVTVGIDIHHNIYVLDIDRGHYKVNQLIEAVFKCYERWHPNQIAIEDVAFQRALRYSIKEEQQKRKRWLPITEVKPHARSKDQRIKGLQPLYANGKVFHNKELVYNDYLEDELLRFPRSKNDDIIDALAYALDLMAPPVNKTTRWRQKYLY